MYRSAFTVARDAINDMLPGHKDELLAFLMEEHPDLVDRLHNMRQHEIHEAIKHMENLEPIPFPDLYDTPELVSDVAQQIEMDARLQQRNKALGL